ncbi:quinone oxidoreductase-like protein 1 [Argiope bruennichi]|uniref:quinone oxidoreductase-like protein 1 n=1 Tax=Argiope bruennichi TaxID=94029 RepID=UPI0024948158|nr:quinone oxidoreductase-like protein 1 [Argiope bruennichi]
MSVKKMRSVYKEVVGTLTPKYIIENNTDLPPLTRYSVLIEVKACSLSEVDIKLMQLVSRDSSPSHYSVGKDISGIVREVGNAVTSLKPGDEVVGIIPLDYGFSGCAEYVVLHEFDVTKKPETVSFVDAAACIGDAVRSYTALHYLGRLSHGDTVLVMDGASAFGSLCIQLAHHWGAKVITTVSSEDEKLYLDGLEDQVALVIDQRKRSLSTYHTSSFRNGNSEMIWSACMEETGGLGVDLIVDNGVTLFSDNEYRILTNDNYSYPVPSKHEIISALAVGGRWITSKENLQLDPPNSRLLFLKCASLGFLFEHAWTLSSTQQGQYLHILMDIMEKVADGVIRPNVYHTVSFDSVPETMKKLPSVRVGKIVMKMD